MSGYSLNSQTDPNSLKFTAIRVRLSALTSRRKHQVVVISNETTSRDLIEMVVKKARMELEQAPYIRLVAYLYGHAKNRLRDSGDEDQYVLEQADKPLVLYDSLPKGSLQFSLEWGATEEADDIIPDQGPVRNSGTNHSQCGESKMADTAELLRMSLVKSIMRYNNWSPSGSPDSNQHKPASNRRMSSEEFLVHYEPCSSDSSSLPALSPRGNTDVIASPWNSLDELANLPGYHAPTRPRPSSHQSDSIIDRQRKHPLVVSERRQLSLDSSHRYTAQFSAGAQRSPDDDRLSTSFNSSATLWDALKSNRADSCGLNPASDGAAGTAGDVSFEEYCLNLEDSSYGAEDTGYTSQDCRTPPRHDACFDALPNADSASLTRSSDGLERSSVLSSSLPNMLHARGGHLTLAPKSASSNAPLRAAVSTNVHMKRSLPKLDVSHDDVEQKRKSISEQFSQKVRQYARNNSKPATAPPGDGYKRDFLEDDSMSVTSLEVADILCGAGPMAPSSDDDEEEEDDDDDDAVTVDEDCFSSGEDTDTGTLDGESPSREVDALPPLVRPGPPPSSAHLLLPTPLTTSHHSTPEAKPQPEVTHQKAARLSHFVEQSMASFLTNLTVSPTSSTSAVTDNGRHVLPTISTTPTQHHSHDPPLDPTRDLASSANLLDQKPVSVFDLLQNFRLSWVSVVRNIECDDSGLVLQDLMVTVRCSSGDKTCVLPCVVEWTPVLDHITCTGHIQKGDLIVEVNGRSALNQSSPVIACLMEQSILVEMVVARKQTRPLHKATSTSQPSASF